MQEKKSFLKSAKTVSLCTLLSRILGLARDIICASFFGTSLAWDAFVVAFKIPNLFRRLFGEGALSAAFIPVFTEYLETKSKKDAWELVNVTGTLLFIILGSMVVLAEISFSIIPTVFSLNSKWELVLSLLLITSPYVMFICMVAFAMAVLNSLKHFLMPALAPVALNACWILGVLFLTPAFGDTLDTKIFGVAVVILIGGMIQLAIQVPVLRKEGITFWPSFNFLHPGLKRIITLMLPIIFGLAVVQINVLMDSFIAIAFAKPPDGAEHFSLIGIKIPYPLETGAASVLYYGDRLIQFPLGVFGIAMATAVFPYFSTYAARKDWTNFTDTFNQAIRVILFIGIPASVGLILLRRPLVELFYERNAFTAESTYRTSTVILFYAIGVWAYSTSHVIIRAFYSIQDTKTPVKVGAGMVALNLILNLTLIWFLREGGLALATAISATIQIIILFVLLRKRLNITGHKHIITSAIKTLTATFIMYVTCWIMLKIVPTGDGKLMVKFIRLLIPLTTALIVFFTVSFLLKSEELKYLYNSFRRRKNSAV
ncbi:MAG: murein biosynthesis integral membrane protein MurJ [Candidatus Scalindua sp.]|jgi:putative peptidoglycan lipid II flippase|nr:murein biosynthesis integral membrane protein MurJ [Candidatus Scalindua sp.]MDV5165975.1 murein biosynthesis integral membrane protein MurJ [Candidatus Scalindua sp.]